MGAPKIVKPNKKFDRVVFGHAMADGDTMERTFRLQLDYNGTIERTLPVYTILIANKGGEIVMLNEETTAPLKHKIVGGWVDELWGGK
jgi:hypothetical protein